ncbi:MAG: hypothetical protein LBK95_06830 [Bifidobacteriaceae bacterium]|nr:hypothetical protein [Bifidobacteriaceae bacterium]
MILDGTGQPAPLNPPAAVAAPCGYATSPLVGAERTRRLRAPLRVHPTSKAAIHIPALERWYTPPAPFGRRAPLGPVLVAMAPRLPAIL